jgi:glycosyltransferase involved in cell wall biosynthesis
MSPETRRSPVFFDAQSLQNRWSAERGIGRYVSELVQAIDLLDPTRITHLVLNRDLPLWESLDMFVGGHRFVFSDRLERQEVGVVHVPSPFEPFSIERVWPPQLRELPLVVTLHDLIPDVFRSDYLTDVNSRRAYRTRLELVRHADRVLVPSQATATDAERRLGIDGRRIVITGEGVSNRFRPGDPAAALNELRRAFPQLRADFVLYAGGVDPRKNVSHLLDGYGRLREGIRKSHQLVIVSGIPLRERRKLEQYARKLGIGEIVFTGFVPDELLVLFYRAARVFVLPSLYEGYGLPIVEALACNAAVLAARSPGASELVAPESTFDPYDVDNLAAALENALIDDAAAQRLRDVGLARAHTWGDAAQSTIAAYDEAARPKGWRSRRRPYLAFAAALPPRASATAEYNFDLLSHLRELCDVDVFTDEEVNLPDGVGRKPLELFETADRIRGGYTAVLCCLAAMPGQAAPLTLLRRRPAVVLAHDVRLARLHSTRSLGWPDFESRTLAEAVSAEYGDRVAAALDEENNNAEVLREPNRFGVSLARDVIARSALFLVHSAYDAELARLDASPIDEAKIEVAPFGFRASELPSHRQACSPLVATFGAVGSELQVERFLDAVGSVRSAGNDVDAAIVMRAASAGDRERWLEKARALNLNYLPHVPVDADDAAVAEWLTRTSIAVQVDQWPNGELWAATARCLSAGIPTIACAAGYPRAELPEAAAVKVDRDVTGADLARELDELLRGDRRRAELADAATTHARENSAAPAAAAILGRVLARRPSAMAASPYDLVSNIDAKTPVVMNESKV